LAHGAVQSAAIGALMSPNKLAEAVLGAPVHEREFCSRWAVGGGYAPSDHPKPRK